MRYVSLLFIAIVSLLGAASRPADSSLASLRSLDDTAFLRVCEWATHGAAPPRVVEFDFEKAEYSISQLGKDEQYAVVRWLSGNGRKDLHNLGYTDAQIGDHRVGADLSGPSYEQFDPVRHLRFVKTSLDAEPASQSNIELVGVSAGAQWAGTSIAACISFKNVSPKVATRVVVSFAMIDALGRNVGELQLDRQGTFSPNIDIHDHHGDNCAIKSLGVATLPIILTQYVTLAVQHVEYADGSSWTNKETP